MNVAKSMHLGLLTAMVVSLVGMFGVLNSVNAAGAIDPEDISKSLPNGISNGSLCPFEDRIHGVPYERVDFPEFGNDVIELSTSTDNYVYGFTLGEEGGRADTVIFSGVADGELVDEITSVKLAKNQTPYHKVFKDKEFVSVKIDFGDNKTEFIDLIAVDAFNYALNTIELHISSLFDAESNVTKDYTEVKSDRIPDLLDLLESNISYDEGLSTTIDPQSIYGGDLYVLGLAYQVDGNVFKKVTNMDEVVEGKFFVLKNISDYTSGSEANQAKFEVSLANYFEQIPADDLTCLSTPHQFVLKNLSDTQGTGSQNPDFKAHIFDVLPSEGDFESFVESVDIDSLMNTRIFGFRFDQDAIEFAQTKAEFMDSLVDITTATNVTHYSEVFLDKEFLSVTFLFGSGVEEDEMLKKETVKLVNGLTLVDAISADNEDAVMLMNKGSNEDVIDMMVANNNLFFLPEGSVEADPNEITAGESTVLSWTVSQNVDSISIDQGVGDVTKEEMVEVSPSETTTFTLTVENANGTQVQDEVTVTVNQPQPVATGGGGGSRQSGNDERRAMIAAEQDEVATEEDEDEQPEGEVLGAVAGAYMQGNDEFLALLAQLVAIIEAIQAAHAAENVSTEDAIALLEQLMTVLAALQSN